VSSQHRLQSLARSKFGHGRYVTGNDADQIYQVSHRESNTISIDISCGHLTIKVDIKDRQTVDEVIAPQDSIGNFVHNAIQVDITAAVNRIGADNIDPAVSEVDAPDSGRFVGTTTNQTSIRRTEVAWETVAIVFDTVVLEIIDMA